MQFKIGQLIKWIHHNGISYDDYGVPAIILEVDEKLGYLIYELDTTFNNPRNNPENYNQRHKARFKDPNYWGLHEGYEDCIKLNNFQWTSEEMLNHPLEVIRKVGKELQNVRS